MKFKVGDKVKFIHFTSATDFKQLQFTKIKQKRITLAQASKSAEKEKAEQERVIEITEKFEKMLKNS